MTNIDKMILPWMFDGHLHLRAPKDQGGLLEKVLPHTVRYASRAVIMPNTRPRPILTGADAIWYRDEIYRAHDAMDIQFSFEPLTTIEIRDNTTPKMIVEAHRAGVVAAKAYPLGMTTNSDQGLRKVTGKGIYDTYRAMQDVGMLLLFHGELGGERILVTERESVFLLFLPILSGQFPDLKIVLEHVSTKAGVEMVKQLGGNLAATITAHHLCSTLNDVIGDGIRPHNGCMPMPKGFDDRDALIAAATSGNPQFFLGSDSAPHTREKKECAVGACGAFTAPLLPQLLAEIFEQAGHLNRLADFTSRFGEAFYGLSPSEETITLVKEPWTVPFEVEGIVQGDKDKYIVPFRAGTQLSWSLA